VSVSGQLHFWRDNRRTITIRMNSLQGGCRLARPRRNPGQKIALHVGPFSPILQDEGAALDAHDIRLEAQPMSRRTLGEPYTLGRRPKTIGERSFVDRYPHSASVFRLDIERQ
jgi:hypothetical protein